MEEKKQGEAAIRTSETVKELALALVEAQKEIKHATKDAVNPAFHSGYATLASSIDACKAAFNTHGIAVIQGVSADGASVTVTTRFLHTSGEWQENTLAMTAKDASPQAVGSAITYGRRYTLQAGACIASEDDDGNAAQPEPAKPETKKEAETRRKKALAALHAEWARLVEEVKPTTENAPAIYKAFVAHETQGSSLSSVDLPTDVIETMVKHLTGKREKVVAWATGDGWKRTLSEFGYAEQIPEGA